ncbi:MAG TPA: signal peptidase II [Steroidobacteraceae bacterium]|nr:signal peptidase II [Steroidobacteraceae bacterium]
MRKLTRLLLVAGVLLGCVGCDQATKVVAKTHLSDGPVITMLHDTVRLTYAENPGAFLGFGASLPESIRALIFQGGVSLMVIGLVLAAALWPRLPRGQVVALTLLGASGLGNLIDRIIHDGLVTDFLNLGIGNLRTGIFNVADMLGVLAVVLLYLSRSDAAPPN